MAVDSWFYGRDPSPDEGGNDLLQTRSATRNFDEPIIGDIIIAISRQACFEAPRLPGTTENADE
jgi:hypothetical protein